VDGLSDELSKVPVELALYKFKSDKKHTHDMYSLIDLTKDGFLKKLTLEKSLIVDEIIKKSFAQLQTFLQEQN